MPASLNAVHLIVRLGRDPEAFHIGQDTLARFNIATDDGYKSSDGQRVERVTWHTVAWGVSASRVQFLDGSERGAQNRNCHDHQQGGYDDDWRN